jgi:hypothetical protein
MFQVNILSLYGLEQLNDIDLGLVWRGVLQFFPIYYVLLPPVKLLLLLPIRIFLILHFTDSAGLNDSSFSKILFSPLLILLLILP